MPELADRLDSASRATERLADVIRALNATPAFGPTGDGYPRTIELLADGLTAAGLEPRLVSVPREYLSASWGDDLERTADYIPVRRYADRTVVLARVPGSDPDAPSVHLTQHYDLPGYLAADGPWAADAGEAWVRSPGANQCRSGLFAFMVAGAVLASDGASTAGDVHISFTPDNHLGGETGAGYLVEQGLGRSGLVVTGGASGLTGVVLGYRGAGWIRLTVHGRAGLPSQPHLAVNAIEKMRTVQDALADLAVRLSARSSSWPILPEAARAPTLTPVRIASQGGAMPQTCVLYVDRRTTPEETLVAAVAEIEDVLDGLRRADPELVVKLELVHAVEATSVGADELLPAAFAASIRRVAGTDPQRSVLPYYTEQRLFSEGWGAQTVGYGPGRSDVAADEDRVAFEDIGVAAAVVTLAIDSLGPAT